MTPGLINCCRVKSNLYKRYKLCPSLQNEDIYKKYRNKLKLVLKKAEKDFYCSKLQVHSGDLKQFWKILNKLIKSNSFSDILMEFEYNGQNLSDPVIIVDKFNDFFTNIGSNLASNVPDTSTYFSSFLKGSFSDSFSLFPTTSAEIINVVSKFPNKSSMGLDEIPLNIMKKSISTIADTLSILINLSFETGVVPKLIKLAKICPIFKNGSSKMFGNYR